MYFIQCVPFVCVEAKEYSCWFLGKVWLDANVRPIHTLRSNLLYLAYSFSRHSALLKNCKNHAFYAFVKLENRVIHSYVVNDKTDFLLLFQPDSESFGK